jgi:hypothetical protein
MNPLAEINAEITEEVLHSVQTNQTVEVGRSPRAVTTKSAFETLGISTEGTTLI